jgi:hypothetical protein
MAAGGVSWDGGQMCSDVACPIYGACCFYDGSCENLTESACTAAGGVSWNGGMACGEVTCPIFGACCFNDGTCQEFTEADCLNAGGTYQGDATMCEPGLCPCVVDLIADGGSEETAIVVGTVTTQLNDDGTWTVTYATTGSWVIQTTHLHLACDVAGFPHTRTGNPRVGRFDYQWMNNPPVNEWSYVVPDPGCCDNGLPTLFAAHAEVIDTEDCWDTDGDGVPDTCREETAWGAGLDFPGRNWAMYFQCNCTD